MRRTFLVIDDSKLHHQMYRLIFSRGTLAGSTVYLAANGREGYGLLAAHPELSMVFLDLNMAEALHLHIPIVLVTTEATAADEARGRAAGAWEYLRKPFQPADIERLVERAVAGSATAG